MKPTSTIPPDLRAFDDASATRQNIYDYSMEAMQKRFPLEDDRFRVEASNLRYTGPKDFSLTEQKKALLTRQHLKTPLSGTLSLIDKQSGKVVEQSDQVLVDVPYYSDRGTIIHNGNEYAGSNQHRLLPGPYVRQKRSGEIESQFNVNPGSGRGFRIFMDPDSGVFKLNIGQSAIPAYPVLKASGISDDDMVRSWGKDMWRINSSAKSSDALKRAYDRLAGSKAVPGADVAIMEDYIRNELPKFQIDPEVTLRTLGLKNKSGIDRDVLLRSTQKILNVSLGEEEQDDRDAPKFKRYFGPEDLFRERIEKDAGKLARTLMWKASRNKSLKPFNRGAFNPYFVDMLNGSGLFSPLEESNPLHYLDQMNRVTGFGAGGIGSAQATTDEARDINPNQLGFLCLVSGPESEKIGIDSRFTYGTYKGKDGKIYGEFLDAKTNKKAYMSPDQVADKTLGFSSFLTYKDEPMVYAIRDGKTVKVPRSEVDIVLPSTARQFAQGMNMGALPTAMQAGRNFYVSKFQTQYLPLVHGEAPLVDSLTEDGKTTFRQLYGKKSGTLNATEDGVVTKVTEDAVQVKGPDGKIRTYDAVKDLPFNRLSSISYYPTVQVGQQVKKGDMLAHSDFTDPKTGGLVIGTNLRTCTLPAKGFNHDDAVVISETAAQKLATRRLYGFDLDAKHGVELGRDKFKSLFQDKFSKQQYANLDEAGIVKPGTVLQKGDPIVLGVGPKMLTAADAQLGRLHKTLRNTFTDKSITWDHDYEGVVVDAVNIRNGRAASVNVKCAPPMEEGDKLSSEFAVKGVVSRIVADDEMPRNAVTNEPYEIMMNPMAILSRVSPNQILAMNLAKIAKKTGHPVMVPQDPPPEGWNAWVENELKKNNIPTTADVFDPESGKTVKGVGDGYIYVHAFHHLGEKKQSGRGGGGAYDVSNQPAKGGFSGSKKWSGLDLGAALAHGVPHVISDAIGIRGTKNEEFWKRLRSGQSLPAPQVPFIYEKFLNTLRAGGINVIENGSKTKILPMTDSEAMKMSKGELQNGEMLDYDFNPRPGGLFDPAATGGTEGKNWNVISLTDPVPNPIMEEPVRRLLGLRVKDLEGILSGTQELNGSTGGAALKKALAGLDIDKEIAKYRDQIGKYRGANRDNAIKCITYLDSCKKNGMKPSDWMVSKIPVLPPIFRPVARMGDMALTADLNELYRDLIETRNSVRDLGNDLDPKDVAEDRLSMYNAVKAVYGLGQPITPEGQSKHLKGAIWQVVGDRPKEGLFQNKVIAKTVDNVSRAVIIPDPNLDMDHIGLPEESAWASYKDFVARRLTRRGYPLVKALELIKDKAPVAKDALIQEMQVRPVIIDRAPTWHKFNLVSLWPTLVEGTSMRMPPLVTPPMGGDYDGDTLNFHVPVTDKAVDEAIRKMMPSKNLFGTTGLTEPRYTPKMEFIMGLYHLTKKPSNKPVKVFPNVAAAKEAYRKGEIMGNDPIEILNQRA